MPEMMDIRVLKCNLDGEVTWQYEGQVLKREANYIVLEAFFDREDRCRRDKKILKEEDATFG